MIRIQNTGEQAVVLSPNIAIYRYVDWFSAKQDRQRTCDVTWRHVRATTVVVQKQ